MVVSRKPSASAASEPVDVDALIRKGGSVPEDEAASSSERKTIPVTLRVPSGLLKQVDEFLKTRPFRFRVTLGSWKQFMRS